MSEVNNFQFMHVRSYTKPFKMLDLVYYASVLGCNGISLDEYVDKYAEHFNYTAQFDNTFISAYNECIESVINTGVLGQSGLYTVITDDNRDPYIRLVIDVAYGIYKYYLEHRVNLKDHCSLKMIVDVEGDKDE